MLIIIANELDYMRMRVIKTEIISGYSFNLQNIASSSFKMQLNLPSAELLILWHSH